MFDQCSLNKVATYEIMTALLEIMNVLLNYVQI